MHKISGHENQQAVNAIRSKHRLAEISHHFLSEGNERLPAWEKTTVIPVLLGSKNDDYVVYELNHAFNCQDNCSMVLNIENRLSASDNVCPIIDPASGEEESAMPEYCLIPASSPSTALALKSDRIIIAVRASLAGIRIAYDQLAFLASLDTDLSVCVVMLEAKTIKDAKRFFGFLRQSAHSLLSLEIECGGYLLQTNPHIAEEKNFDLQDSEIEEGNIATSFEGVATTLLKKFTTAIKSGPDVSRLIAPTGPAALLS